MEFYLSATGKLPSCILNEYIHTPIKYCCRATCKIFKFVPTVTFSISVLTAFCYRRVSDRRVCGKSLFIIPPPSSSSITLFCNIRRPPFMLRYSILNKSLPCLLVILYSCEFRCGSLTLVP